MKQPYLANMEEADSTLESAEDMTAADTAPSPKNDTKSGVRCCSTSGRIMEVWSDVSSPSGVRSPRKPVSFHAAKGTIFVMY